MAAKRGVDDVDSTTGVEELKNGVRVRVFIPFEPWARFQRMAKLLGLEERILVRVLASLMLAQMEGQFQLEGISPELEKAAEADYQRRAGELLPDMPGAAAMTPDT